jgi:TPR repeat protein
MKLKTLLLTLSLLFFGINTSTLADFNDGYDAYQKGDYKTAFSEWKSSAEQGEARAQYNLGWMYEKGKGVLKDPKQAVKWYRKGAEQGHSKAQYNLGLMYINGTGILKDLGKAKHWINKAYEGGDAEASKLAKENWDKFELWKY